jgi:hypothetical protein
MNSFFPFIVLLIISTVYSAELRRETYSEVGLEEASFRPQLISSKLRTQSVIGDLGNNLRYISVLQYEKDQVCGNLTSGKVYITNVCLSNGATSEQFTCSKLLLCFFCFSQINFSLFEGNDVGNWLRYSDPSCIAMTTNTPIYKSCTPNTIFGASSQLVGCTSNAFGFGGGEEVKWVADA